ncbi:MAG: GDP-mannose 4,6-dehydratase [Candidatus Aenigmarchaeota archaeon]|nr:GDP-mannose 4,6-dehydratase [Candidatus Aenigmarchaeota archaeon]
MGKVAFITGILGQDGSYLADFLLSKGYTVYGMKRRLSHEHENNIKHARDQITLVSGDLLDHTSLIQCIKKCQPDEVYNLAAQSFVPESWAQPVYTGDVTGLGVLRMLEAIKEVNPAIRFYQASSSEMFGKALETPQRESTPFYPRSPYGVAKVYGHYATVNHRESYNAFACSGILFNHESPRRGMEFVTRKITNQAAKISAGMATQLALGNLNAKRDWGFALDYVEAMWMMLQQERPDDYVVATGQTHSVREFVELAFKRLGMNITWEGEGVNERGLVDGKAVVIVDKKFYRPADVEQLVGDASKAGAQLGWKQRTSFPELVNMMVDNDVKMLKSGGS